MWWLSLGAVLLAGDVAGVSDSISIKDKALEVNKNSRPTDFNVCKPTRPFKVHYNDSSSSNRNNEDEEDRKICGLDYSAWKEIAREKRPLHHRSWNSCWTSFQLDCCYLALSLDEFLASKGVGLDDKQPSHIELMWIVAAWLTCRCTRSGVAVERGWDNCIITGVVILGRSIWRVTDRG